MASTIREMFIRLCLERHLCEREEAEKIVTEMYERLKDEWGTYNQEGDCDKIVTGHYFPCNGECRDDD